MHNKYMHIYNLVFQPDSNWLTGEARIEYSFEYADTRSSIHRTSTHSVIFQAKVGPPRLNRLRGAS